MEIEALTTEATPSILTGPRTSCPSCAYRYSCPRLRVLGGGGRITTRGTRSAAATRRGAMSATRCLASRLIHFTIDLHAHVAPLGRYNTVLLGSSRKFRA